MKHLLITLWLSAGLSALAQGAVPAYLKTRITDDSQTLSIQLTGYKNGQAIQYNQTFDVVGRNTLQKELLKYRAFSSVGLGVPIHEIPWLLIVVLGTVVLIISLLIIGYQARQSASVSSARRLPTR